MTLLLAAAWPFVLLVVSSVWPELTLRAAQWLLTTLGVLTLLDAGLALAYERANKRTLGARSTASAKGLALVTGASAGLGKEMARLLAERGYALVLVARRELLLQELQSELKKTTTTNITYCVADLGTPQGIDAVIEFVRSQQLGLDVLVNNAGASVRGELSSLTPDQVESFIQLNVSASTKLTHAVVPGMVKRGRGGQVLIVSSMAGEMPNPKAAIYGASKSYLTKFAQSTNQELIGMGVQVTVFLPGPLHTEFGQHADCQGAIYMNMPGRATVPECARAAIAAMEDPLCTFAYDNGTTWLMTSTMAHVLPRRLSTMLAALSMEDPKALVAKMFGSNKSKAA